MKKACSVSIHRLLKKGFQFFHINITKINVYFNKMDDNLKNDNDI